MPDPISLSLGALGFGLFKAAQKATKPAEFDFPQADDPRIEQRRRTQLLTERKRKGRASTILTGGAGLQDEPTLQKASLLGG